MVIGIDLNQSIISRIGSSESWVSTVMLMRRWKASLVRFSKLIPDDLVEIAGPISQGLD